MGSHDLTPRLALEVSVPANGSLSLRWPSVPQADAAHVLLERTGRTPGFACFAVAGARRELRIENLGRGQRYRVAVVVSAGTVAHLSARISVTPDVRLAPRPEPGPGVTPATLRHVWAMPQDRRLTVFLGRTPGFVTGFMLLATSARGPLGRLQLDPDCTSVVLDATRFPDLTNGAAVRLEVTPCLGALAGDARVIDAVPAPPGDERRLNAHLDPAGLVYPSLGVGAELDVFAERPSPTAAERIVCGRCGAEVAWRGYELACAGCGAEYIPNGFGAYLDRGALRFGTCLCCLPRKVLIAPAADAELVCAHSGKAHIQKTGAPGFELVESLRLGLCQCCRPRRPLGETAGRITCSATRAAHVASPHGFVLATDSPIIDAAVIDALMDAGLADLTSRGVTRAAPEPKRKSKPGAERQNRRSPS